MTEQISIFELISNASLLVQIVMLLLAIASVVSWMMIFQRWLFLRRALNEVDSLEDHFWSGIDLREFYGELSSEENLNGIETIFVSGFREYTRLSEQAGMDADAIMQGVQRSMRVALNREEARLETHLPFFSHSWLYQSLCRFVWHCVGHHEFVSFPCEHEPGNFSLGCTGNLRSLSCNRNGVVCCYSRGDCI